MSIGVIGLGAMGRGLARNLARNGYHVVVYNRTNAKTLAFLASLAPEESQIEATEDIAAFAAVMAKPRKILLMVKAGPPTDDLIQRLLPLLTPGDVLMDGGNAHFTDTERRMQSCEAGGVRYLGIGISGGESGALYGPSIMAGGPSRAYDMVGSILESIAAEGPRGRCCALLGARSAGHYVKMVHNGIEYAVMQTISEAYDLMKRGLGMSPTEMAAVFESWNGGEMASYLLEITAAILRFEDPETGCPLVESILDMASQKGTGRWSSQSALDLGTAAPSISAAVFARIMSALKDERTAAEQLLTGPSTTIAAEREALLAQIRSAVHAATAIAYAQGFRQLQDATATYGYGLNLSQVARVWMAGCIIRSQLLHPIADAFDAAPGLSMLFLEEPFRSLWQENQAAFRHVVVRAHEAGIPVPAMSSALEFLDAYRTGRLPANLLQAQRDFFGAHTYQRIDADGVFHTEWDKTPRS